MIKELWDAFKIPIIVGTVLLTAFLFLGKFMPMVREKSANATPVVSIEAENKKEYRQGTRIKASDFKVTAIHENGKRSSVDADEIILSKEYTDPVGKKTEMEVSLKKNKKIKTSIEVKNRREPVILFNCGTPILKDVQAVLYDNGELCFEGKGDVLQFHDFPWITYMNNGDSKEEYPIRSVTFSEGVTPAVMDKWFYGMNSIEYVGKIPSSVESMEETFYGCSSLKEGVDWSVCLNLKNVTGTYEECKALIKVPELPAGIRIADRMCKNCGELSSCPSVKKATLLESGIGMFAGCVGIASANLPPNIQIMDEMYADCINLKKMPVIPDTVTSMKNSFSGDLSLKDLTNIPEKVSDISNCFTGCKRVDGILTIDATPQNYGGCFQGAVVGTKLLIKGKAENLEQIVSESNNRNITMDDNKEDDSEKEVD